MTNVGDTYIPTPMYMANLEKGLVETLDKPKAFPWKPVTTKSMG
jgi:hypothetical protein